METLDLNPRIESAMKRAKISDLGTILSMSCGDLERATQLSANDVQSLQKIVAQKIHPKERVTALDLFHKKQLLGDSYLTTGCSNLDTFLGGGILCSGINEIAGESACGKTQFCMQLCLTCQLPKEAGGLDSGALYVCTEDAFPNKRLMQMVSLIKSRMQAQDFPKSINFTDNIFIEHASDLDDLKYVLTRKVPLLLSQKRIKLVIIDSIAAIFRCEYGVHDRMERARQINQFGAILRRLSSKDQCTVVCINQVTANMSTASGSGDNSVIPSLGIAWANWVTVRLLMRRTVTKLSYVLEQGQKAEICVRDIESVFAPHLPNSKCRFVIDEEGVKGLD